jgi:hypothetical protein
MVTSSTRAARRPPASVKESARTCDLLDDARFPDGRYLETLRHIHGNDPRRVRRLLIQIKARGIMLQEGEGRVLIKNKPFDEQ